MKFNQTTKKIIVTIEYPIMADTLAQGKETVHAMFDALGYKVVKVEHQVNPRSDKQNAALHLYFDQLAEELSAAGFDMKKTVREEVDIPWTAHSVKENLWRPVQEKMFGKKSTTKLNSEEMNKIYDTINRAISERTGVHVPFPSMETMMDKENEYQTKKES